MRNKRSSVVMVCCVLMLLTAAARGQDSRSRGETKIAVDPRVMIGGAGPIEIYQGEPMPYRITAVASITDEKIDPAKKVTYMFRNTADKDVVGFAVVFSLGETRRVLYPAFFDNSGKKQDSWLSHGYAGSRGDPWTIEVDYVLFADGTSWGPDVLQRSRVLKQYQNGRNAALARIAELGAGLADEEIKEALKVRTGIFWAASLPLKDGETETERRSYMLGYVGALHPLESGNDIAKTLAARVRAMETWR